MDPERLNVPKPHQVAHFLAFMCMFGPIDMARLNVSEGLHKEYAKEATKRTRRHVNTMMDEIHKPVDRYEAWVAAKAYECGLAGCNRWQDHVRKHDM